MMTGGKVIVTYKRKRLPPRVAYKCRRLPSRDELDQKNENCDLNLAQTSIEQQVEPTTINEWECPVEGSKHLMKEGQGHLAVAVKASESENKNQNIPNSMQLVAEPLAVLETNPVLCLKKVGLSVKDETNSLCTKRKLDPWLITYQRRCKRKKDVNELQMQHGVGINRDGSLESTSSVFAQEATQSKSGSEPSLVGHTNPECSCLGAGSSCESECFKQVADNKRENIRSEDTSSVAINTQIAEVSPCSLDENSGLKFQEDSLGKSSNVYTVDPAPELVNTGLEFQEGPLGNTSNNATTDRALEPINSDLLGNQSNDATVDPVLKTVSSGPDFQEGPLGNTSNNDRTIDPALQFLEGPSGNSSNDAAAVPAHEPVNTSLEFQEVPLGNLSSNDTVDPSLEPVNSGLEFHKVPLGNSSNNATVNPALEAVTSGLEFQEGPLRKTSNNASTIDPVFEFLEGPFGISSNNAVVPALEPVNSGLVFQEGPLGNLSNSTSTDPSLKPVNSGLGFQEGALGNSSNNLTIDPALKPVNYGLEFQEGHLGNSSNNATVDLALESVNSGLESQEDPLGNSSNNFTVDSALEFKEGLLGNSLNNASVGPLLEPVLFNKHSSIGEETPVFSGDAPDTRVTHEIIPCSRVVKESLDLSVPPSCSVGPALEPVLFNKHSSTGDGDAPGTGVTHEIIPCSRVVKEPLDLSVPPPGDCDSTSGEHNAPLNDKSPGVKGFDFLHANKSEAAEAAVVRSYHELTNSSPAGTSRSSYLQLFPEDRMDDLSRSTKMHQSDTAGSSSRGKSVTSGHDRTAKAKSSLLYGLFLPLEVANDGHKYDSASSQWPAGGIQYRDFLRAGSSKDFPGQSSTSQRRRMVVDGMVDRARTPKRSRISPSSLYGYPAMWSEEELDSLWIGVRRYGRGNWEFMLRDPRLAFTPLRTPWDLALQWEQEQSKLLNNIPSVQGRQFRQSTALHGMIGRHHLMEGVNLSLGDVYSGNNAPIHHQQTVTSTRPAQDADCSSSTGRNCPHWLKEIVAVQPKPTEEDTTAAVRDRQIEAETRGPGELIVIESDASSEETISDDDRGAKL